MRADGIVRRFDDLGRILIPKELRIRLFGKKSTDGEPMEIFMDGEDIIILRKYKENKADDVCEWKKSKDYPFDWLVGCDGCEVNHKQGDYCPRCGKKIKVVKQMKDNDICKWE